MSKLSTERAIEVLYTIRGYYASLTAGYPKGKDCKGIDDVMCSEIANSCLMAIKALEQDPSILADMLMEERIKGKIDSDITYSKDVIPDVKCKLTVSIQDHRPCYCGAGLREVWRENKGE